MSDRQQQLRRERWVWAVAYFLLPYLAVSMAIMLAVGLWFGVGAAMSGFPTIAIFSAVPAAISLLLSLREDRKTRPALWDKELELWVHQICPECGYDLRATHEPRCPECGRRLDPIFTDKPQ